MPRSSTSRRSARSTSSPPRRHQLAATYIDAPIKRVYTHTPSFDKWTPTPHDLSGDIANLSWNFSISQDLFLETKLATQTSNENKYLAPGGTDVRRRRSS